MGVSKIPTEPCAPGMVKAVALAMFYGITIYKRAPWSEPENDYDWTVRHQSRGWNIPSRTYRGFGLPGNAGHIDIGGGLSIDQWQLIFKALSEGGGWEWEGNKPHGALISRLDLPEDYEP